MGRQLQKVWVGGGEPGCIPRVRGEWRQGWSLLGDRRVKVFSTVCGIILSRSVFERQGMGTGVSKRVWRRPTGWMGMRRWEKKAGGTLVTGLGDKRAEQTQWVCRSTWRSVRLLGGSHSSRGPRPTSDWALRPIRCGQGLGCSKACTFPGPSSLSPKCRSTPEFCHAHFPLSLWSVSSHLLGFSASLDFPTHRSHWLCSSCPFSSSQPCRGC